MKNTLILMGLMSLSVRASEKDFKELIQGKNFQTLTVVMVMVGVGTHKLFIEANEYCQVNAPFCWKIAAPLIPAAVFTGGLVYRKLTSRKG